jgi:hypothetical protein
VRAVLTTLPTHSTHHWTPGLSLWLELLKPKERAVPSLAIALTADPPEGEQDYNELARLPVDVLVLIPETCYRSRIDREGSGRQARYRSARLECTNAVSPFNTKSPARAVH